MRKKYWNKTIITDGKKFDSLAEFNRYNFLKALENDGVISNLVTQIPYKLSKNSTYIADFQYTHEDKLVVEDVKNVELLRGKIFQKKAALMRERYGIEIKIIHLNKILLF